MKYADLIDPQYPIPPENILDETYILTRSFSDTSSFIHFHSRCIIQSPSYRGINTNWKARLSIHPDDMDKAWEIIFPILCEKNAHFKVANRNAIERFKNGRQEKLEKLIDEYNQFLHNSNALDIKFLRHTYYRLSQELAAYSNSQWRLISFAQTYLTKLTSFFIQLNLNRENLFAHTKNVYERLIELRKQKVENSLRLYEGMQFTIYILPGFEKKCQNMLDEIEVGLVREGVRSGRIYPTDRQIGIYSSIRHPGKWSYHKATDFNLETYNPDNIDDHFSFLSTLPTKEIMQEDETRAILEHEDSPRLIVNALRTKKFIAPSILKALAVHKENIVECIKISPLELRSKLKADCLDKSTNLGTLFRVQRGLFTPQLGHGTLKQIEDISLTSELIS